MPTLVEILFDESPRLSWLRLVAISQFGVALTLVVLGQNLLALINTHAAWHHQPSEQ